MEIVKRLKRELVYKGTVINMYKDTVQVQNGHIAEWDFIGHKGAAAVVPVLDDGRILMVKQYRNALDRMTIEVPAGGRDTTDEHYITCASRELEEETGFRSETLEFLMTVNTTVAFCDEQIGVYIAKDLIPSKQHLDADESIDVEEWEVKDLLEMIYTGKMTDAKTIAAILAYAQKEGIR